MYHDQARARACAQGQRRKGRRRRGRGRGAKPGLEGNDEAWARQGDKGALGFGAGGAATGQRSGDATLRFDPSLPCSPTDWAAANVRTGCRRCSRRTTWSGPRATSRREVSALSARARPAIIYRTCRSLERCYVSTCGAVPPHVGRCPPLVAFPLPAQREGGPSPEAGRVAPPRPSARGAPSSTARAVPFFADVGAGCKRSAAGPAALCEDESFLPVGVERTRPRARRLEAVPTGACENMPHPSTRRNRSTESFEWRA